MLIWVALEGRINHFVSLACSTRPQRGQRYCVYHARPAQTPRPKSRFQCFDSIRLYPSEKPAPTALPSSVVGRRSSPPRLYFVQQR